MGADPSGADRGPRAGALLRAYAGDGGLKAGGCATAAGSLAGRGSAARQATWVSAARQYDESTLIHHLLIASTGAHAHIAPHLHGLRHAPHGRLPRVHRHRRVRYIHLPLLSHIRIQGPAINYVGLFLLAILSGLGINGFGEAALIAAAVYVANHHLSVAPVVALAAAGGFVGGVGGFLVGKHGGRTILAAPGPLRRLRRKALARSEDVYLRHDSLAVLMTPAWAAGIHAVRWGKFLWLNLLSAALWAGALGLGGYYLGSRITTEFSDEIGWIIGGVVATFVVYYFIQRALRASSR